MGAWQVWVPFICIPTSLGVHPLQPRDRVSRSPEASRRPPGSPGPGPSTLSYLHGVGADDLAAEPLAQLQSQGGLASARGPENHYKWQRSLQAPEPRAPRNRSCSRRRRHLGGNCACAEAAVPMATLSAPARISGSGGRVTKEEETAGQRYQAGEVYDVTAFH